MNSIGALLLALWLISQSIIALFGLRVPYSHIILPVLAISAAVGLLWPALKSKMNVGWLLLSVWLILGASMELFHFSFSHSRVILAIISLGSGFFLIIRK